MQAILAWITATSVTLSEQYGVHPVILGILYFGTMPPFALSVAWWIRRFRRGESTLLPASVTGVLFIAAYLYVLVASAICPCGFIFSWRRY